MSIGSTIPMSQAVTATTDYTVTKVRDGIFTCNLTGGGSSKVVPIVVTLKPCIPGTRRRHIEISMTTSFDLKHGSPVVDPLGSFSMKFVLDSVYGQDMTDAVIVAFINRFCAVLIQNSNAVPLALLSGGTE